jgi:ribosomal protein S14
MNDLAPPVDRRNSQSAAPLVFPAAPIPGQSIAEVILEAAADNCYRTAGHVISAAGIDYRGDPSIFARARGREEDLAITLRMPDQVELLRSISPNPVAGRPGWSDFFGVPLRNIHRDMKRRRVSPRRLARSLHLKAIWSVRVLSFDPLTKELLLDRCPECGRRPTYLRTYGIQHCEFCVQSDEDGFPSGKVDFRDFPQPLVEVDDAEGLDFVVGLIDPERTSLRDFTGDLHADFANFGAGDLFELTVATACALTTSPSWKATTLDRPSRQGDYARFTPDVLSKAARMLLDWPDGFHRVAAEVREGAKDRTGHYGVRKELGPLVALGMDANLRPEIQRLIKHRITLDMGITSGVANTVRRAEHRYSSTYIPIQKAAQEYGVTRRAISRLVKRKSVRAMKVSDAVKAPVLVDSQQLAEMIGSRIFGMPSQSVAVELGIPRACLRSLAEAGFLVRLEPGPLTHRSGDYYLNDSVDELRRRCEVMAVDGPPPAGWVRITKAVNRLGLADANPWPEIVAGILGGQIKIWRVEGRLTALMTSHAVKDVRELALNASHERQRVDDDIVFTQVEAADFLKTTSVRVNGLIRLGLLCPQPTVINLKEFAAKFVLTAEISEQFASRGRRLRWRDVPTLLRASGVEPVTSLNGKAGLVWQRSEVDRIIAREGARAVN